MRVHVQITGRRIAPFGDAPGDVRIANQSLADWQARAFREAGLTVVEAPEAPCLVVPDTLFTTGPVLRRFVDGAQGRNAVLGLAESVFGRRACHVQPGVEPVDGGWRFDAVRFVSGGDEPATTVWIDPEEQVVDFDLPAVFRPPDGDVRVALARHPVLTIHHWVHILWANQAAGASEARRAPWYLTAWRVFWAILRTRSLNRWRILGRMNTIGRGCDIHPTAVVEGSQLGDNVRIGPYARVLFSRVGDGAHIMPCAQVEVSTIGERATVAQKCFLRLCVLYPDSFAGQDVLQASVLGRGVLLTGGSYSLDLNFDQDIRVLLDGKPQGTGGRFLGAAFGHGARVGAGVWLASGRAIPNHTVILGPPDQVIVRVPEHTEVGTIYANDHGTLAPTGRALGSSPPPTFDTSGPPIGR